MNVIQSATFWQSYRFFLHSYRFLPHRALNRTALALSRVERPRRLVRFAMDTWVKRGGIRLEDFEGSSYSSIEAFFLRRLRSGARPLGAGFVSPVDGQLVGVGPITGDSILQVKGRPISLSRLVNGRHHRFPIRDLDGGIYTTIFLSPDGYHHVHMPDDAEVVFSQWVPGRYFPQNGAALSLIPRIYERNERLVLGCRLSSGVEFLLILVGASLVGGIHLEGLARTSWVRPGRTPLHLQKSKGDRIGHFSFGSTVVVLMPRHAAPQPVPSLGSHLRMGESLMDLPTPATA